MTERSFIWDSGGGGDASPHSEANTALLFGALVGDRLISANKGVIRGVLNGLVPSSPGAGQVRIASGAAISDGHPYISDANVDFTPTTPSVGTTGHRIVLRASWSAQTVRLTDISSADGTATIPAMTQTPGTTYDIPICSFTKSTAGVIASLADNREFAGSTPDLFDLVSQAITNAATGTWKGLFWAPGHGIGGDSSYVTGVLGLKYGSSGAPQTSISGALADAGKAMGELRTSGALNDDSMLYTHWGLDPQTDSFEMAVVCYLNNDANRNFFFGLSASNHPGDTNDRIGFRVFNNGNIIAFTDTGSAESTFDYGAGGSASPGTLYALKIVGTAGVITFYVNGTAVFSTSSNVPSTAVYAVFGVRSTTAAQDVLAFRDLIGRMKAA